MTRDHACEHCKGTFKTRRLLRRHLLSHATRAPGGKTIACPAFLCTITAANDEQLLRHMRHHTGEKRGKIKGECPCKCDERCSQIMQRLYCHEKETDLATDVDAAGEPWREIDGLPRFVM